MRARAGWLSSGRSYGSRFSAGAPFVAERTSCGRLPSVMRCCEPSAFSTTRGIRSRYCGSMPLKKASDSVTWQSAETMKYLFGSPGRAVRFQPSTPGLSMRQAFFDTDGFSVFIEHASLAIGRNEAPIFSWVSPASPLRQQQDRTIFRRPFFPHRLDGQTDRDLAHGDAEQVSDDTHVRYLIE